MLVHVTPAAKAALVQPMLTVMHVLKTPRWSMEHALVMYTGPVITVTTMSDHATPSVMDVSDHPTKAVLNVFLTPISAKRVLVSVLLTGEAPTTVAHIPAHVPKLAMVAVRAQPLLSVLHVLLTHTATNMVTVSAKMTGVETHVTLTPADVTIVVISVPDQLAPTVSQLALTLA
jgi:hypothetical protein